MKRFDMKCTTVISIIFTVLLMFGVSSCGRGEAILTYDSEYFPLVGIDFGISEQDLRNQLTGKGLSSYTSGTEYEGKMYEYKALSCEMNGRDYGGRVNEDYYFNKNDELVCMDAYIHLMASSGYYRNAEKMEEFKVTAAENAKAVFEMIVSETGIAFDKTPEDIVYGYFLAKGNDGEREVYVKIHFGFPSLDKENFIAGENGSFTYCNIDMFVKPAGVTTGFEMAYEE